MGRRKKKNYQSLSEIQEDNAMRMASDAITEDDVIEAMGENVLAELRGEVVRDELIQDAMDYLPKRRAELAAMSPAGMGGIFTESRANMSPSRFKELLEMSVMAEDRLSRLGRLPGNVPMPIIRSGPNGEVRTHVEYEDNDITGQRQVVPFMDPNSPTQALQTIFGVTPSQIGRGEVRQADELVMENALKLQGNQSVQMMPHKYRSQDGTEIYGAADFRVVTPDGRIKNVDAEQFEAGSEFIDIPSHTAVQGHGRFSDPRGTQELLQREVNNGKNIFDAIGHLVDVGMVQKQGRVPVETTGKLASAQRDVQMHPEERYNSLIRPVYSPGVRNQPYSRQPRNVVTAPQSFMENNLELIVQGIKDGDMGKAIQVRGNAGGDGRGRAFHKVFPAVPINAQVNGKPVAVNPMDSSPMMQQLLDTEVLRSIQK